MFGEIEKIVFNKYRSASFKKREPIFDVLFFFY
jgi:hypothetical protein